ncbi:MAG: hypothetical protein HC910_05030 [Spirulinaceae cyanobacterium SM2_1_0]|nr:hypothetical protein [Spirulinaceae cyanobacterium SM2_1_0]
MSHTQNGNGHTRSPSPPSMAEMLDADILDAEVIDPLRTPEPPPPTEPVSDRHHHPDLVHLEQQLRRDRQRDRHQLLQNLQDTENRILRHLFDLYGQTNRLERKLDRLLGDRQARQSQRSTLALFGILLLGIAYITVIQPLRQQRLAPPAGQPAPNRPAESAPVPPEQLSHLFGSAQLAQTPSRQQQARGRNTRYRITDHYRLRPVHPSTGQRSHPDCLGKSLTEIDAQNISGCVAHRGADVGTPVGTPLAAIALPGAVARVDCIQQPPWGTYARLESQSLPGWTFIAHHLQTCRPGTYPAGSSFGTTGSAGTGPHLHFGTKYEGKWLAPPLGFIEWMLAGERPQPLSPT